MFTRGDCLRFQLTFGAGPLGLVLADTKAGKGAYVQNFAKVQSKSGPVAPAVELSGALRLWLLFCCFIRLLGYTDSPHVHALPLLHCRPRPHRGPHHARGRHGRAVQRRRRGAGSAGQGTRMCQLWWFDVFFGGLGPALLALLGPSMKSIDHVDAAADSHIHI